MAVRAGIAGCAVTLTVLLTGCGGTEAPPAWGQRTASGDPSAIPTEPGVDGEADPDRVFTAAELKTALLPAEAFGKSAKVVTTDLRPLGGPFAPIGHGDWSGCEPANDLREELNGFDATSATQTVRFGPVTDDGEVFTVQLVSMPAERTVRYLEIQRRLRELCPEVTVDTEAAPVAEHHAALDLAALGDEAMLDILRVTGGDEYDGVPTYAVDVRVGGVLAIVTVGADKSTGVSLAAQEAQRIRAELYGTDDQGVFRWISDKPWIPRAGVGTAAPADRRHCPSSPVQPGAAGMIVRARMVRARRVPAPGQASVSAASPGYSACAGPGSGWTLVCSRCGPVDESRTLLP